MSTPTPTHPVVYLADLIPDGCNFEDRSFREATLAFMREHMSILNWTIMSPPDTGDEEVDALAMAAWVSEWERELHPAMLSRFKVVCSDVSSDDHEEDAYLVHDTENDVWHTESNEYDTKDDALASYDYWADEDDAFDYAMREELDSSPLHGFPFAQYQCYLPSDLISTADLIEAGFVVYSFRGTRIAGIDGGGYSFAGAHFGPLCALTHESMGWPVPTDAGQAVVSTSRPKPDFTAFDSAWREYEEKTDAQIDKLYERWVLPVLKRKNWEFLSGNGIYVISDLSGKMVKLNEYIALAPEGSKERDELVTMDAVLRKNIEGLFSRLGCAMKNFKPERTKENRWLPRPCLNDDNETVWVVVDTFVGHESPSIHVVIRAEYEFACGHEKLTHFPDGYEGEGDYARPYWTSKEGVLRAAAILKHASDALDVWAE